ncbi:cysteine desulfurase family protein [Rhodococcus oxybenzonivorans]|uniref:cysteine desulfurase family protein n=1 Tax=Rhodococcus oxybenzonivorans TaxID=1990687 RepID=UPI0029547A2D|nr:cysteine desulfurase family protein [Rhodococcus oxybenzonivorans]MDV7353465.1 cysteine desulfurase family protein [Rhodococcus oxybenzonivorans]
MIYLDYNASTPIDPRVTAFVLAASDQFANPSSVQHRPGQQAAELLEEARNRVADLVARSARDIVFTSGASEAAVLGIVGGMLGAEGRPNVVVSATEHKAILAAAALGARLTGGEVRTASVDPSGLVDNSHLSEIVDESVSVVAIAAANNETGVLGQLTVASNTARDRGSLFLTDATQLVGKVEISPTQELSDLLVCSSHKIYGPKGAGALIASRHVQRQLVPIMGGGGQEFGLRGGTQNVPALAGFGLAAELAAKEQLTDARRVGALTTELLAGLCRRLDRVTVNGDGVDRLPNTLNLRFEGADSDAVMASMQQVAVSTGSACQSSTPVQSHVLLAMGLTETAASESLRISLGRPTTSAEIALATEEIASAVARVRELTTNPEG